MTKNTLKFLLLSILVLVGSCKKVPTFSADNDLDPEHKSYSLSLLQDFSYQIASNSHIEIKWSLLQDEVIDGVEVYRSLGDTSNYKLIKEVTGTSFTDTPPNNATSLYYKVQKYYQQKDKRVVSPPKHISIEQSFTDLRADVGTFDYLHELNYNNTILTWSQNFQFNATVSIYKKTGAHEYIFIDSLKVFDQQYNVGAYQPTNDSTWYKLEIANTFDTLALVTKSIHATVFQEYPLTINKLSSSSVQLTWTQKTFGMINFEIYPLNTVAEPYIFSVPLSQGNLNVRDLYLGTQYEIHVSTSEGSLRTLYYPIFLDLHEKKYSKKNKILQQRQSENNNVEVSPNGKFVAVGKTTNSDKSIVVY